MLGTSAMTSDAEIARNPHQPEGWRRDGVDFFVAPPPRYTLASRRRRFANSTPSRSPQTSSYLWKETLSTPFHKYGNVCGWGWRSGVGSFSARFVTLEERS